MSSFNPLGTRQEDAAGATIFRSTPFVTTMKRSSTARLRPLTIHDHSLQETSTLSFTSTAAATPRGVSWTASKVSIYDPGPGETHTAEAASTKQAGSMSARGTRKEEFEYLTKLFSGTRVRKGPPAWERKEAAVEGEDGEQQSPAHKKTLAFSPQAPSEQKGASDDEKPKIRGGKLRTPWKLPTYSQKHRPLRFGKYGQLYDVATWSVFPDTQDFAGNGIAALSSIPMDRDVLQSGGAVQYMTDLLLTGKTIRAKIDACEALIALFKNNEACREFVNWNGFDRDGVRFHSGFDVAFRLRRSKSPELQRCGARVLHDVLVSQELKHTERISVTYIEGLCAYCLASDESAARQAGKILAAIFTMVHDTGIRWTIGPITPVVELLKNTEIFPRVRSLAVRAIYLFAKEGDRVLGLLSQSGVVKTMTLQLAVRHKNKLHVDKDDLNYVRVLTSICEVDTKRFEDVILIGGTPRIIQILRAHLVTHKTLLPDETEVQRRCMRFLERVLNKPVLRFSAFEAGCAHLYLDMLEMDKESLKLQVLDCLVMLCEDSEVQALWHTTGTCTARLAVLLQRFSYNAELQYVVLRIFRLICAAEETVSLLVGTDLMDTTIELLDAAVKTEDRDEMHELLAAGVQFLDALVQHKLGRDHVNLWNVIGRIDPNMRKVRGLLITQECKVDIWVPYDHLISSLEAKA